PLRFGAAEPGASIGRHSRRLIGAPTAPPPPRCAVRPRARVARLPPARESAGCGRWAERRPSPRAAGARNPRSVTAQHGSGGAVAAPMRRRTGRSLPDPRPAAPNRSGDGAPAPVHGSLGSRSWPAGTADPSARYIGSRPIGRTSRVSGFTMSLSVSSVTAPSSGASSPSPRTTGEVAVRRAISKRASETPRTRAAPSARPNSAVLVGLSLSARHTRAGSTVYTAPVSTRKRRRTGRPLLLRLTRALTKETPTGPTLTIAVAGGPAPRDAFDRILAGRRRALAAADVVCFMRPP